MNESNNVYITKLGFGGLLKEGLRCKILVNNRYGLGNVVIAMVNDDNSIFKGNDGLPSIWHGNIKDLIKEN